MKKGSPGAGYRHCNYSSTENICLALDQAGVPDDPRWRAFILYAKYVNDHRYLSREPGTRLQSMVLGIFQEKDFSEEKFNCLMEENQRIISAPYLQQLQNADQESRSLLQEIRTILANRKEDIGSLGNRTISAIENGTAPGQLIICCARPFAR